MFFLAMAAPLAPAFAQSTVTYTYDALGRLVRSENNGTSTADSTYTLDAAGNRTNVTVTGSPFPTFSIDSTAVTEGGTAILTVTKGGATIDTLTVNYASADGTASAGSDYTATSTQMLTFLASDSSKTIAIPTTDDLLIENTENFTVTLSGNSAGSAIGQATGTVTINDNDATSFAISDASVTEGGNLVYTVTKTGSVAANISYATADGTATAGSTISTAQGSGTINDNDVPPVSFAISAAPTVSEGGNLVYTVTCPPSAPMAQI
ncbi:MAG: hypothetical protein H6915_08985 [Novosphingobium sp.]|nr:hypothetical protein [Novosphingobium sp.]MCP5389887.1 hypothetical protein [Novosphingobium sp.]